MKTVLTFLITFYTVSLHAQNNNSQTVPGSVYMCYIKYQYDANGNRTNRAYTCEWYNTQTQQNSRLAKGNVSSNNTIVFPNPNTGVFTVQTNTELQDANIIVKNMQGQEVKQYTYNGTSQTYNISNLPTGQYLIEVLSLQNNEVIKLIKQ